MENMILDLIPESPEALHATTFMNAPSSSSSLRGVNKLPPDPDHAVYLQQWANLYDANNYDKGLAAWCLRESHRWAEAAFDTSQHFGRVVEVGAGTGVHLRYVHHRFDEYWMTDLHPPLLEKIATPSRTAEQGGGDTRQCGGTSFRLSGEDRGQVWVARQDATRLDFPDDHADRLIATHVLEHLPRPHEVLREWVRVLKPGGVLTLVLPCDPGVAWRLGRYALVRRKLMRTGFEYDYWMAREHINPINVLVAFCRHYFALINELWWPTRIPSMDANLFYIAHMRV